MIEYEKKQIQILFKQPEISDGSPISSFKIYYSSTPTPESKSLFKKVNYDEVFKDTNGNLLVSYDNPVVGTPYYFFVTACNKIGESLPSEASPVNIVDYKPSKPEAPLVKKLDGKTVVVFGKSVVGEGSPPSHFVLITEKSGVTVKSRHEVMTRHTSISEMKLFYAVDEGIKYRFAISAVNKEGESEVSSYTPEVDIGN